MFVQSYQADMISEVDSVALWGLFRVLFNTVWVWFSRNVRCRVLSGAVPGRPNSKPQAFLQVRWCARAGNLSRRRRRRRSTIWQKLLVKRVWNAASCSLIVSANLERRSQGGIKTCCCWRAPSCDLKDVELPSGVLMLKNKPKNTHQCCAVG